MSAVAPAVAPSLSLSSLRGIATGLAAARDLWRPLVNDRSAARDGTRLLVADAYDVWLLSWPEGSNVSPHDHGDAKGAFVVVAGELTEIRWSPRRCTRRRLGAGQAATFGAGVIHDVLATGGTSALSVHAYSPPLRQMRFYSRDARRIVATDTVEAPPAVVHHRGVGDVTIDRRLQAERARIGSRVRPDGLADELRRGALVIDTRPTFQRERDGELPGAVVIDRNQLEWRLDPTSPHRIARADHHDRRVVIVCDEGYASSLAAASLRELGLSDVTDLDGGYQAWRALH